jgi:hypothetical protein
MEHFDRGNWKSAFRFLKKLQQKEMEEDALQEAFAKTEEPLGWYFAGKLSDGGRWEQFDFYKKSAEGGCSWGQVKYGDYFEYGRNVEKDKKVFVEWLEKAANQNNPQAMDLLGLWFRYWGGDKEKAVSYYRDSAELSWKYSMYNLAEMLRKGEGCEKDLIQAVVWVAKGVLGVFWNLLADARRALESGATEDLGCDFNQLCYSIGWGLFWYQFGSWMWHQQDDEEKVFGSRCLDFYCSCVELQQKSIITFLSFWNRTTGGVKEPGRIIAQMVWEGRETIVLLRFGEKRENRGCILF